jgi:hypothetical protein
MSDSQKDFGLVSKTNVLVRVPEPCRDDVLCAIEGSGQKIGVYGRYDCVMSDWPVCIDSESHSSIWTFCEPDDEEEARVLLQESISRKARHYLIDFIDGRVLMLYKYDSGVGLYVPERRSGMIYTMIDAPWGDWQKTGSFIMGGKNEKGEAMMGNMMTWPATGYFRPLPGSSPRRGRTDVIEEGVKYKKFLTSYNARDEEMVVNGLREAAGTYELPVMSFFAGGFSMFPYIRGADITECTRAAGCSV